MKKKIIAIKNMDKLDFYLIGKQVNLYLFTQAYTKGVYAFFRNGKSEKEVKGYKKWNRNPRLDKTIEKIPLYVQYVTRETA